ncbi:MAG: hioM [Gemmataceae bacterium]|nr:hioM [Gemmataceae bacterium]
MTADSQFPDPSVVLDLLAAFRRSKTMFAAAALGVFDALEAGPKTAPALAADLKADPGALARLLDACVGLGLLRRAGPDGYANTPAASAYLTSTSPRRLTGYLRFTDDILWKLWDHLEGSIRDGAPGWKRAFGWDGPVFANLFHTDALRREFLMGMHGYGLISSPEVVAAFDLSRFRRLVDLGGATGHLAVAACRRYPDLRAVVFDLPQVIPLASELIATTGVADRVEVTAGDFFTDPLPAADVYALGRILHDWTEEKILTLLRRAFDQLPTGGAVLVAEKLVADDRAGPSWAQMQDLNMLLVTEGRERTLAEYADLLKRVGFAEVSGRQTDAPVDAILAIKR